MVGIEEGGWQALAPPFIFPICYSIKTTTMVTTPIHVFARWKVKAGNMPIVLELFKALGPKTREEKGNLFYKLHQSQADANTLVIFEGYADEFAQKAHTDSDHYQKLVVEQILPLLEEREVTLTIPIGD
jgi:autoinducer 2-degrading protein